VETVKGVLSAGMQHYLLLPRALQHSISYVLTASALITSALLRCWHCVYRSDVASWGLAARGRVTTADLALHALCRVIIASAAGRQHLLAGDTFLLQAGPVNSSTSSSTALTTGTTTAGATAGSRKRAAAAAASAAAAEADDFASSQESCDSCSQGTADGTVAVVTRRPGMGLTVVTSSQGGTAHEHLRRSGAIDVLNAMLIDAVLGEGASSSSSSSGGSSRGYYATTSSGSSVVLEAHQLAPSLRLLELVTFRSDGNATQVRLLLHSTALTQSARYYVHNADVY
jgi:hypothetical protein